MDYCATELTLSSSSPEDREKRRYNAQMKQQKLAAAVQSAEQLVYSATCSINTCAEQSPKEMSPEQSPEEKSPEQSPEENSLEQSPKEKSPEQSPKEKSPEQSPKEKSPEQSPPKEESGQPDVET